MCEQIAFLNHTHYTNLRFQILKQIGSLTVLCSKQVGQTSKLVLYLCSPLAHVVGSGLPLCLDGLTCRVKGNNRYDFCQEHSVEPETRQIGRITRYNSFHLELFLTQV